MNALLALTVTASMTFPSAATPELAPRNTLAAEASALAARVAAAPAVTGAALAQPGGDSLKNGAIAGAVLGGLATAAFVGYLCGVFGTEEDNCAGGVLVWAAIGAAGGAALGAGVDAMFDRRTPAVRQPRIAVRVRF